MTRKMEDINPIKRVVDSVERKVENVIKETDEAVEPVRKSAFHRFPTLFTMLVAFGVATTFFGFERIIADIMFLDNRPWLILLVGISVLIGTGTLYKKLG